MFQLAATAATLIFLLCSSHPYRCWVPWRHPGPLTRHCLSNGLPRSHIVRGDLPGCSSAHLCLARFMSMQENVPGWHSYSRVSSNSEVDTFQSHYVAMEQFPLPPSHPIAKMLRSLGHVIRSCHIQLPPPAPWHSWAPVCWMFVDGFSVVLASAEAAASPYLAWILVRNTLSSQGYLVPSSSVRTHDRNRSACASPVHPIRWPSLGHSCYVQGIFSLIYCSYQGKYSWADVRWRACCQKTPLQHSVFCQQPLHGLPLYVWSYSCKFFVVVCSTTHLLLFSQAYCKLWMSLLPHLRQARLYTGESNMRFGTVFRRPNNIVEIDWDPIASWFSLLVLYTMYSLRCLILM